MMTRMNGGIAPPESRKMVCNGERLLSVNASSKPLEVSPEVVVTVTLVNASSATCGTGTGTAGPTISVRLTPLSTGHSRYAFWQGDPQPPANRFGQFVRAHRAVRIAHAPELF